MDIGQRIKSKRLQLGLTQLELGKKLGMSKAAVCKAEYSKNDMTTDRIAKFADALGCTSAYLMGWEDEQTMPAFSPEHIELIRLYSALTPDQKKNVMSMLRSFVGM